MDEQEFDLLAETHSVVASGWSSATLSAVTVLGNEFGTPVAMRYTSTETDGDFRFINLSTPKTLDN